MSTLFGVNKPNVDLRKNAFDLSAKTLFSMSAGHLLPCMCREVNPGEKVQLSMAALTRTQPLNTAAYVRNRQYFHFFFVPFKQLWSGWDNFINGVDYKQSALQKGKNYTMVPRLDLMKSIANLIDTGKLLNGKAGSGGSDPSDLKPMHKRILTLNDPADVKARYDEHGYLKLAGMSRLLDMLGYGYVFSDVENATNARTSLIDVAHESKDFNSLTTTFLNTMKGNSHSVNIFRLLAYQKIYNDFYKRDDYEVTNPTSFNIDDFDGSVILTDANLTADRLIEMLTLRYRWSPKDYFTGVVPSELMGISNAVSSIIGTGLQNSPLNRTLTNAGFTLNMNLNGSLPANAGTATQLGNSGVTLGGVNNTLSVSTTQLRAMLALEKLNARTRRAGGHDYISQTMAHYGFEPPKGRGDKVQFLGGYANNIDISEVITTANGSANGADAMVGQIFGKGVGGLQMGKDIDFQAQEHGVIMCIASIVPEVDYPAVGLDQFNAKFNRGDYFQPEFADLGLQPVYNFELKNKLGEINGNNVKAGVTSNLGILGFAPRYAEYKTSYDTLHGEFRANRSLSAWSASSLLESSPNGVIRSTLKVNPRVLDNIFAIDYDGSERTDQFNVQALFNVKIIRPMSITGQSNG